MPRNRSWQLRLVCYWRRLTSAKALFYPNRMGLGTHRATTCRAKGSRQSSPMACPTAGRQEEAAEGTAFNAPKPGDRKLGRPRQRGTSVRRVLPGLRDCFSHALRDLASEDRAEAPAVMDFDCQCAERRFGDISRATGQSIRVDDALRMVIGVAPRGDGIDASTDRTPAFHCTPTCYPTRSL